MALNPQTLVRYFEGSDPIKFSDLKNTFGDATATSTDIKISDYKRNVDPSTNWTLEPFQVVPRIPDATENEKVSSDLDLSMSGYRGTILEYNVDQSGSDEELEWINEYDNNILPIWNGNLSRNILKKFNITGTIYSNEVNKFAFYMAAPLSNLNINVQSGGRILGEGGVEGGDGSSTSTTYTTVQLILSRNDSDGTHTVSTSIGAGYTEIDRFRVWSVDTGERSNMDLSYKGGSTLGYAVKGNTSGVTPYSTFTLAGQNYSIQPVYQFKNNAGDIAWTTSNSYNPDTAVTTTTTINTQAIHRFYYTGPSDSQYYLDHVCDLQSNHASLPDDKGAPSTNWTDEGIIGYSFSSNPASGTVALAYSHPNGFSWSSGRGWVHRGEDYPNETLNPGLYITAGAEDVAYKHTQTFQVTNNSDDIYWSSSLQEISSLPAPYVLDKSNHPMGIAFWSPGETVSLESNVYTTGTYALDTTGTGNSDGIAFYAPLVQSISATTNVVNPIPGTAGGGALYVRNKNTIDTGVTLTLHQNAQVWGGGGSGNSGNRGSGGGGYISCSQWTTGYVNNNRTWGNNKHDARPGATCREAYGSRWIEMRPNQTRSECRMGGIRNPYGERMGATAAQYNSRWTTGDQGYQCSKYWTVKCNRYQSWTQWCPGAGWGGTGGSGQGYSRPNATAGNPGYGGGYTSCPGGGSCGGNPGNPGNPGGTWGQPASGYGGGSAGKGGYSIKWKNVVLEQYQQGQSAKGAIEEWNTWNPDPQDFIPNTVPPERH